MATPTVNPPASEPGDDSHPAEKTKVPVHAPVHAPVLQSLHYKLVITLYRVFAITVLYLVLAGIVSYAFVMGFYAVNR